MQGDSNPRSLAERFFRICLLVFGGVILLVLTIELIKSIWWILTIAVLLIAGAAAVAWWRHRRNTWQ